MQKILGLDIGTNSIGWALIETDLKNNGGKILGIGSRIIPMDGLEKDFEAGTSVSKAADRRLKRGARRLLQRYKLRRTRLINVLKCLNWFPENFPTDFKELAKFNINEYMPYSIGTIEEAKKILGITNKKGELTLLNDWIIYYLRTKALTEKISLAELGRVIYHFNQRRGFKSSRKANKEEIDIDESKSKGREKYIAILRIEGVEDSSEKVRDYKVFTVTAMTSNEEVIIAYVYRKEKPDWIGSQKEFEVTKLTSKAGEIRYELRDPDKTDKENLWEKLKIALEKDIKESGLHPGEYLLTHIINDRNYRIKERIIDRSFYLNEIAAIWEEQSKYHPELTDRTKIPAIIDLLYRHNETKRKELLSKSIFQIINDDIIYYQRELKSQRHLIADCQYERKKYKDKTGKQQAFKVISKSHPAFQEFRIWQDIHNIRILKREERSDTGKTIFDVDISNLIMTNDTKAILFTLFDSKATISTAAILKELSTKETPLSLKTHRLNYPDEKEFKGNETKAVFRKVFKRHDFEKEGEILMNDKEKLELLWHINYSLNDEKNIVSAVVKNFNFHSDMAVHFAKIPVFKNEYASYSYKAINKLLPFMRCGSRWSDPRLHPYIKERIIEVLEKGVLINVNKETGEIKNNIQIDDINALQGMPVFMACYIVYGRPSEKMNYDKFESWDEIKLLDKGGLRNPIVEQITNETLQVVKELWKYYGRPDEIHIELARDLKNNSEERQKITKQNTANEADRKRIVAILKELRNTNPDSLGDIERLRLWEESGNTEARNSFPKFSREPSSSEIEKYKLWGEQNHISPYTGKVIPLSKLFTAEYQIEHIIPRSRYFDDSFGNKTICEAWVNSFKDNSTAMQVINEYGGRDLEHQGTKFKLFAADDFIQHVKDLFRGKKQKYFLSESIPEGFIERQLNDTRYIGRKLAELLYPVAKDENGLIFTSGNITSDLKEKWGLHRIWKEILRPRFERLETISGEKLIDFDSAHNNIRFKKDYKRVDHRHHALDALIIAATSRSLIQYLNTLNAQDTDNAEKKKFAFLVKNKVRDFVLPWETFSKEAREALQQTIVSHKTRSRIVTKGFNVTTKYVQDENGQWIKKAVKQEKGNLISVRKSMFKEPFGKILLAEYKKSVKVKDAIKSQLAFIQLHQSDWKGNQWRIARKELRKQVNELLKNCEFDEKNTLKYLDKYPLKDMQGNNIDFIDLMRFTEVAAKRVTLDKTFTAEKIDNIPYSSHAPLAKIMKQHLLDCGNVTDAFTGEGLEKLAKKVGKPINKITTYEAIGSKIKFQGKYVEADKGSNQFFVIYENMETGERIINSQSTLPLLEVIERKANNLPIADNKEGYKTILLSPNDLVYIPEEGENIKAIDWVNDRKRISERIYKVVSFTKSQIFFIPHYVSSPIIQTTELGANNKSETSWNKLMIKRVCIKIKIDRLGNIQPA